MGEVRRIVGMPGILMARPLIGFTDTPWLEGREAPYGWVLGPPAVGRLVAIFQSFAFSRHRAESERMPPTSALEPIREVLGSEFLVGRQICEGAPYAHPIIAAPRRFASSKRSD